MDPQPDQPVKSETPQLRQPTSGTSDVSSAAAMQQPESPERKLSRGLWDHRVQNVVNQ